MLTDRAARVSRGRPGRCAVAHLARLPAARRAARTSPSTWRRRCSPDISASRAIATAVGGCATRPQPAGPPSRRDDLDGSRSSSSTSRRRARSRTAAIASPRSRSCCVRDGVATTVFDTLINPERPIPPAITAVTNITWAMVQARATLRRRVRSARSACSRAHVFVAHNATLRLAVHLDGSRARDAAAAHRTVALHGAHGAQARAAAPPPESRCGHGVLRHRELRAPSRRRRRRRDGASSSPPARRRARPRCTTLDDVEQILSAGTAGGKRRKRRRSALPHSVSDDTTA